MSIIGSGKNTLTPKYTILFVGSFKQMTKDGSVGGQMFACNTIINSNLNSDIDWVLIDTTADSNKPSGLLKRLIKASKRILILFFYLFTKKFDSVLIFVGDGWSFWEKGFMVLLCKALSKAKIILAPRSGFIVNDIDANGALHLFIKKVFNTADYVICQSKYWKSKFESLSKIKNDRRFVIIENGLDLSRYISLKLRPNEVSDFTILYMAWVDKNKGIFDLLSAIISLKKKKIFVRVIIAGDGSAYDMVKRIVVENELYDQVVLFGWAIGDVKFKHLEEADVFVLPTHFEGYPNSLIEAMAAGKACIATRVGSIPDILEDSVSGLLVNVSDPKGILEALLSLVENDDLRRKISLNARQCAIEKNSIERFVAKLRPILVNDNVR